MKILQINKFFFLKGGTERYFFDLAELLTNKEHQVIVWSVQHPENFPWPDGELFAQFSDFSKKQGFFKELRKVRRIFWNQEAKNKLEKLIRREKPALAHCHNIFSHFSPSIISLLKKYNIPIVMTLHDYKLFCPNYRFFSQGEICYDCLQKKNYRPCWSKKCLKNSWSKSLIGYLEGKWQKDFLKVAKKIDCFLAPSLFIKRKALQWGIPANKIIHLPNFVDLERISFVIARSEATKQSRRISSGLPRSLLPVGRSELAMTTEVTNPYFLYFGRLSPEKGIDFLIKAFIKISQRLPQWRLKIVGDGPEKEKLKELSQGQKQIEFLNRKKGRRLKEIIFNAYSTILPSLWPENFPYSILESFALAKPVIAADVGGIPELVKEKKTGLLFQTKDEDGLIGRLKWAISHPGQMKKMGRTAQQEILLKYNPEKHYQNLIKVYERIQSY